MPPPPQTQAPQTRTVTQQAPPPPVTITEAPPPTSEAPPPPPPTTEPPPTLDTPGWLPFVLAFAWIDLVGYLPAGFPSVAGAGDAISVVTCSSSDVSMTAPEARM